METVAELNARIDEMDRASIAMRWYGRRDPEGGWCVMDADTAPTQGHPPIIYGLTERLARHIARAHNTWTVYGDTDGDTAPAPGKVECPWCCGVYALTAKMLIRVHNVDGYRGGYKCPASGLSIQAARTMRFSDEGARDE